MSSGKNYKIGAIVAGVTVGAVVIGYFAYRKRQRKQAEDTDEGIGDVDSIISEGEVEEAALSQIPAGTRVSTSDDRISKPVEDKASTSQTNKSDEGMERNVNNKDVKSVKVLVLGLDGSGKTSMLNLLASKTSNESYQPTTGFNAVQIGKENLELNIVEVGGNETTRSYWQNFTNDSHLLVYVLDGADRWRYQEAKTTLKNLLDDVAFKDIACLLVSNKQDREEACKVDQIFSDSDIQEIAKKGVSTITLLNTICIANHNFETTYKNTIMEVILDILRQRVN